MSFFSTTVSLSIPFLGAGRGEREGRDKNGDDEAVCEGFRGSGLRGLHALMGVSK